MPCLQYELAARHLKFATQVPIPIVYKGMSVSSSYRIDLIVEDIVVVELRAAEHLAPVHEAQVLTYLVLAAKPVGLLINFNVAKLTLGVKRLLKPPRRGIGA